jgi:hypothetical protein
MKTRDILINSSCRRRPASIALIKMDPGLRQDDDEGINQRLPDKYKAALDKHCLLIPAQAGQKRMAH